MAAVLVLIAVALTAALAMLANRALAVADREAALQREVIAERLFDDMEQTLTAFIAQEDARPFDHWRPTVLAQGSATLVPSPLAEGPPESFVVAYFQIDPDATVSNPHELPAEHPATREDLGQRFEGWGGDAVETRTIDVVVPPSPKNNVQMAASKPAPKPAPAAPSKSTHNVGATEQRALLDVSQTISRGASKRSQRREMQQTVMQTQVSNFVDPGQIEDFQAELEPQAAAPLDEPVQNIQQALQQAATPVEEPVQEIEQAIQQAATPVEEPVQDIEQAIQQAAPAPAIPAPRVIQVQVPDARSSAVDVAVSPLSSTVDAQGRWLTRTVRVDGRTWVQGMLIDDDALRADLAKSLRPLEEVATLSWSDGEFEHRFAAPFEGVTASLTVHPLDASDSPWNYILGLTALVAAIAAVGLGAAWRTTTASLALAEERSDFVSAVTHELRSPLTSIRMYAEMLESGMAADPGTAAEYHTVIREEAERLSRLVEDVLTMAGLERGGLVLAAPEPLGDVITRVAATVQPVVGAQNQTIHIEVSEPARSIPVPADALTQVLSNLIDNASKFSVDATDRRIHIEATATSTALKLVIRDHGPGVTEAVRTQMFTPFFRGERELTRKTRGTGIGLSLVAGIVGELGGTVLARNHADGGLEVVVQLPR
ncbi:MAG: hypothetical protein KC912_17705 [Proteobacteria bacterium]|nr:hypothetical protein [Pseudomonadota bacterium]